MHAGCSREGSSLAHVTTSRQGRNRPEVAPAEPAPRAAAPVAVALDRPPFAGLALIGLALVFVVQSALAPAAVAAPPAPAAGPERSAITAQPVDQRSPLNDTDAAWYEAKWRHFWTAPFPPGPTDRPGSAGGPGVPGSPFDKTPPSDPRQATFDVLHYDVQLVVDIETQQLTALTSLVVTAVDQPIQEIVLDFLDNMTVEGVYGADESEPLGFTHAQDRIVIQLSGPLDSGHTAVVRVVSHGHPEPDGIYGFQFIPQPSGTPVAASLSEPWSARSWWPCKDDPSDKAPFSTTIFVPPGMTAVSNGSQVPVTSEAQPREWAPHADDRIWSAIRDQARRGRQDPGFTWIEPLPLSTYQFSVAVSQYVLLEDTYNSVQGPLPIRHYVYPDLVDEASSDFAILPQMLAFCEDHFGPYPFPGQKYGHALFEWDGAMEHPTETTYGSELVTGDGRFASIIMHELAHQWFGNMITPRDWSQVWLNEGFATYAQALWAEETEGFDALRIFMAQRGNFTPWTYPLVRDPDSLDPWHYFLNEVYFKGAWVLHMLRHVLGDGAFWDCMHAYLNSPDLRYGVATSDDFIRICEATTHQRLEWYFDQWLYWWVHPIYSVQWENLPTKTMTQVHVMLEQVQPPDPEFGDVAFQMPIDLRLTGAGFDTLVTIFNDRRTQAYRVKVPGLVQDVELDPNGWLLHRIEASGPSKPPQLETVRLLPPAPNPFNPACRIQWEAAQPSQDVLSFFDVLGRRLLTRSWPLRPAGRRQFVWDGRDDAGRDCAAGVYLYTVEARLDPDASADGASSPPRLTGKVTLNR